MGKWARRTVWIYSQEFYVVDSDLPGKKEHLAVVDNLQQEQVLMQPSEVS